MEPETICECGHIFGAHRMDDEGVHECTAEGCDCEAFESAADDPEDD